MLFARVCQVYGITPEDLASTRMSFYRLLVEHLDTVEREHAYYMALAQHEPAKLQERFTPESSRTASEREAQEQSDARHELFNLLQQGYKKGG